MSAHFDTHAHAAPPEDQAIYDQIAENYSKADQIRLDAERYRWLRENGHCDEKHESRAVLSRDGRRAAVAFRYWVTPEELDAMIDAMSL